MTPTPAASELLPCPFCGGKAESDYDDCSHGGNVKCLGCGAKVYEGSGLDENERWNRRQPVTPSQPQEAGDRWTYEKFSDADGRYFTIKRNGGCLFNVVDESLAKEIVTGMNAQPAQAAGVSDEVSALEDDANFLIGDSLDSGSAETKTG